MSEQAEGTRATLQRALRWAAIGDLSSRVAHESNNLLAGILGQAELGLLSGDPARMKAALESIVKSSRELKSVTERVLGFSRLIESSEQSSNLLEIFRTLSGMFERSFVKASVKVERRYGDIPMTWCDPGSAALPLLFALRHALETLVPAGGGSVLLEALVDEGTIVFRVQATPAEGQRLPAPAPSCGGDLTFAQAEEFARQADGAVRVENTGHSLLAECRFPIRRAPGRDAARAGDASASTAGGGQAHGSRECLGVLVVEDESTIRDLLREILESLHCAVHTKPDAAAALESFARHRQGVIFTDLSMPGMDGVTLVRKLIAADPRAVVIVITGRATEDAVTGALAAGAKMVLRKPFELADIRAIVDNLHADPSGEALRMLPGEHRNVTVPESKRS